MMPVSNPEPSSGSSAGPMTDAKNKRKRTTLYLVDGTSQLFRAYFAIRGLTNPDGLPTNAVFGFTSMLRKLIRDEQPDYLGVAFDLPGPVFRNETYAEYKAHRPPTPEDLNVQFPYAKEVCAALGVQTMELEGFEADDLIGTLARLGREQGFDVVVVASDKDLLQLVDDEIKVFNPSKELWLDADGVTQHFGVPPSRVRDVLGLMGDSVDNIPGVPGVGEKTALAAVSTYGDVDEIIARAERFTALYDARDRLLEAIVAVEQEHALSAPTAERVAEAAGAFGVALNELTEHEADTRWRDRMEQLERQFVEFDFAALATSVSQPGRAAAKPLKPFKKELKGMDRGSSKRIWYAIRDHAAQARLSKELATLHTDAPTKHRPADLQIGKPDRSMAHALFKSLGFGALTKEFAEEAAPVDAPERTEASHDDPGPSTRYETILARPALEALVELCRGADRFAVDTETDSVDPIQARLVGISLSTEVGTGAYIPVGHDYIGAPEQLALDSVVEVLAPLLADPAAAKVGQNLKYDAHILRRHGMPVEGWTLDTMVAAFLLNSSRASYSMDSLAEEFLGHTPIKYAEIAGSGAKQVTLNQVDVERVAEYAAEDADVTLRLARELEPRLDAAGLRELYETIDGPLLPLLERMEAFGIRVESDVLAGMSGEMQTAMERSRKIIHELAGTEFNVDSPKQLRDVLFDRLGLKPRRTTAKSRVASTDAQTLEQLADEHEIAREILEYRELAKLKGTYVDALPRLINPETGRVHTSYHPTGAATGRLSSSDPNLQNIPARTETGRRIRSAFVADPGYLYVASDYSQVELRVLAHLADDPELIEAFRAGEDIHRYTASRVFGLAPERITATMRRRAKAVNFGILYGMSETRLAREQGMARGEARQFIRAYFERFSSIRDYIDGVREQVLRDGAVRTMFGRVRYFPQLHQRINRAIQEQALRAAVNTTIQGTAADLMKLAMLEVDDALTRGGLDARMLLQVHDELLIEAPDAAIDEVGAIVKHAMETVHPLKVPLAVDQKTGRSWLEVT
jgi:DNA polymerase-1